MQLTQYVTMQQLAEACASSDGGWQQFCLGYIAGAVDSLEFSRADAHGSVCVPPGVKLEKVAQVFMQFVSRNRSHPDFAALAVNSAVVPVILAVSETWCPTGDAYVKSLH
jgi:Rap1a immunity proteins